MKLLSAIILFNALFGFQNAWSRRLDPIVVRNGSFFDTKGRRVLFRGVNVVYKDAPWFPATDNFHSNLSFVEDDAKILSSLGINLIRLGTMWPGVLPQAPGPASKFYLEKIRGIIRMAAQHGIYSILDPHQDEFSPRFCGEGVPDWWVQLHNASTDDFPVPVQSRPFPIVNKTQPNFPGRRLCDTHSSFSYIWSHAGSRAYQKLWEDASAFADFWKIVASSLGSEPSVVGGELFNEPFPGVVFDDTKYRDNHYADMHNLQPFYANVTTAIRQQGPIIICHCI